MSVIFSNAPSTRWYMALQDAADYTERATERGFDVYVNRDRGCVTVVSNERGKQWCEVELLSRASELIDEMVALLDRYDELEEPEKPAPFPWEKLADINSMDITYTTTDIGSMRAMDIMDKYKLGD